MVTIGLGDSIQATIVFRESSTVNTSGDLVAKLRSAIRRAVARAIAIWKSRDKGTRKMGGTTNYQAFSAVYVEVEILLLEDTGARGRRHLFLQWDFLHSCFQCCLMGCDYDLEDYFFSYQLGRSGFMLSRILVRIDFHIVIVTWLKEHGYQPPNNLKEGWQSKYIHPYSYSSKNRFPCFNIMYPAGPATISESVTLKGSLAFSLRVTGDN